MMKTRTGFVSNSSSSSFIVAAKTEKDFKKAKMTIEIDLTEFENIIIRTREELKKYFLDDDYYETIEEMEKDAEWTFERYSKALKAIEEGKIILIGTVSSDGCGRTEGTLYNNGLGMAPLNITGNIELVANNEN